MRTLVATSRQIEMISNVEVLTYEPQHKPMNQRRAINRFIQMLTPEILYTKKNGEEVISCNLMKLKKARSKRNIINKMKAKNSQKIG